jgi:hypothetical protein
MNLSSELIEKLRQLDELTILELLELTTADLIDAFPDRIEDNYNRVIRELEEYDG